MASSSSGSPSHHVYTIECSLRVTSDSTTKGVAPINAKKAQITVGRDGRRYGIYIFRRNKKSTIFRKLLLIVHVSGSRSMEVSYPLRECKVHTKDVTSGKGSIHIRKRYLKDIV